jgi:hypothetical protein
MAIFKEGSRKGWLTKIENVMNGLSGTVSLIAAIAASASIDSGSIAAGEVIMKENARDAKNTAKFHTLLGAALVVSASSELLYPCKNQVMDVPRLLCAPQSMLSFANMVVCWSVFSKVTTLKVKVKDAGGVTREEKLNQMVWNAYLVAALLATACCILRCIIIYKKHRQISLKKKQGKTPEELKEVLKLDSDVGGVDEK